MIRKPTSLLRYNLPFITAVLLTFLLVYLIGQKVISFTGGIFIYPLDDPYIHMQIARNIVESGAWGINSGEFGSASSSLFYTILLSVLFKLFSINANIPLIINCIGAVFLLYVIQRWLKRQQLTLLAEMLILSAVVLLAPLPVLIISGMEHVLQALFFFLFVSGFAEWFNNKEKLSFSNSKVPLRLLVLAILVVMIRFEGLFLIFGACLMLLYRKQIFSSVVLGGIALLPVVLFGLYSIKQGSYFLPNSVLVKSEGISMTPGGIIQFFQKLLIDKLTIVDPDSVPVGSPRPGISLLSTQRLLMILPLLFIGYKLSNKLSKSYGYILLLLMIVTILHLCLAATGWLYRYEAYLVITTIVLAGCLLFKVTSGQRLVGNFWLKLSAGLLVFTLFFPWVLRSAAAYTKTSQACINIYEQQYQMGQFLQLHYDTSVIAANDIGAISYFTHIKTIDLWGLGNIEVARSKKGKYWTPQFLNSLVNSKQAKIAVVYDEWFDPDLRRRWTKVASWKIPNNVICGSDVVNFYSVRPDDAATLKSNLQSFQASLPSDVAITWY